MIPSMRFFTLSMRFEVDGGPAPSPPARHVDRRAVGAVVVPVGFGLRANNDRGRSDRGHDTHNAHL